MLIYPVVMCGGAGTRLWPVSRPSRAKQFVPLIGPHTLLGETIDRVAGLPDIGRLIVVAGEGQRGWVSSIVPDDIETQVLLEPEGRDSAAAIAAAALAVAESDPEGIAIVLASDHHVPDAAGFRDILLQAVETARGGSIVTLGVRPDRPSTAYGYIKPGAKVGGHEGGHEASVSTVAAFVEKPDEQRAASYIADGYLWNSGNFIARADVLLAEFQEHVPDLLACVREAFGARRLEPTGETLSDTFRTARKVSVDYAVMEHTSRASVISAPMEWSDLGAWDTIHATLDRDPAGNASVGPNLLIETTDSLLYNRTDRLCVVDGADGLNVVVDEDVVLVSRLDRSQQVKGVVEALKQRSMWQVDVGSEPFDVRTAAERLMRWLSTEALPLWWTHGFDHEAGMWREELLPDAGTTGTPARARVQGRQTFTYALARSLGWGGPAEAIVKAGLGAIGRYRGASPLIATLVDPLGEVRDDRVLLYDQTFVILALAAASTIDAGTKQDALEVLDEIEARFERVGDGFREANEAAPFQSNAHMHLLEASMAWMEQDGASRWAQTAERIVRLAKTHLIDTRTLPGRVFVREFFDADWKPASGRAGQQVEPGHQFEWAWLLGRWARLADDSEAAELARALHETGRSGVDPVRGMAVDAMIVDANDGTLAWSQTRARLWPQAEWLKSALSLAEMASPSERAPRLDDVRLAHKALAHFLDAPVAGLWFDKCAADGTFEREPAPASSLYHIATAIDQLQRSATILGETASARQE